MSWHAHCCHMQNTDLCWKGESDAEDSVGVPEEVTDVYTVQDTFLKHQTRQQELHGGVTVNYF